MVGRSRTSMGATRRRDQRGASAVEFAFIVPILFALLFLIITGGLVFFRFISLNDSVRAGARFGATTQSPSDLPVNWPASTVRQRTVDYSAGTLASSQVCVALVRNGAVLASSLGTSCTIAGAPASPSGVAVTDCVVKVWAAQPAKFSAAPFYTSSITMRRASVARYERPCL